MKKRFILLVLCLCSFAAGCAEKTYTLRNAHGVSASFSDYGGRWLSMNVPDRNGIFADVVLGFDNNEGYRTAGEQYHGAVTGRVCGRINQGICTIDGKTYRLANNDLFGKPRKNHLHGGVDGFHKKIWDAVQGENGKGEQYVEFSRISKDGEEDYPGNLKLKVRYTLTASDAIEIDYQATTDKTTLVNLTNHAYFNLSGDPSRSVSGHILWLNADKYVECDKELIPTGKIASLKGLPIDFSTPTAVGARLDADFPEIVKNKGFAIAYAVNNNSDSVVKVAQLTDSSSGRTMEVYSNQPSLQVYNAWLMDGTDVGKGGVHYNCGAGIVIETQGFPDAPNHSNFPQVTLHPGELYHHIAVYSFAMTAKTSIR